MEKILIAILEAYDFKLCEVHIIEDTSNNIIDYIDVEEMAL